MSKLIVKVVAEVDVLHVTTPDGRFPLYLTTYAGKVSSEDDTYTAEIMNIPDGSMCLRMKHGDVRKSYLVRVEDVFLAIMESEDMKR